MEKTDSEAMCLAMAREAESGDRKWTVEVDVYLESDDPLDFTVHSCLQQKKGGNLVFHNNGRPGFNIVFHLFDRTGKGYRFPSPPHHRRNAVWSQLGDDCPEREILEVLEPLRVINNGKTLVVYNANPEPKQGPFKYTLRVTKDGKDYLDLDPGGDNQNGGWSRQ